MVDRADVRHTKPAPDLFLACQAALGVEPEDHYVMDDAVWAVRSRCNATQPMPGLAL